MGEKCIQNNHFKPGWIKYQVPKIDIFLAWSRTKHNNNKKLWKNLLSEPFKHRQCSWHSYNSRRRSCVPVVTSHLNIIVLDPLFLLKYVTAYLAMHLLKRRNEKDKPCVPVDASYLSGMVISQPVTPEERRWEGQCRWGVLECTISWLYVFVPWG